MTQGADPEIERQAIALFEAMLDTPEAGRDAWLKRRAGDRPALLARVNAMRAADRAASLQTGGATADAANDSPPPERLGAYRLGELIGRGGMGSVYRATRDRGDFTHVVAVKIIKPGLLSASLVDRFRRERQTLAGLSHPNIAQLFDGGETDEGAPFIVMEYVDGVPLLDWAEGHAPDRARRLALFDQICRAVAVAHRNLVVHRDITPSNVLVTPEGLVKLIDFGIARPVELSRVPEDAGAGTSLASLSLTPGYAAPERMVGLEVTTAADVYSLGKVLERLMIGVRDSELDAIIARATAADPAHRYPTVDALAADCAAWAGGQPVAAVDGGRRYRARKFVARNRAAIAAAALGLVLLIGALGATSWSYLRAETARRAEAARFADLRSLAGFVLFDLNGRLSGVVGNVKTRLEVVDRAQRYLSGLASSPTAEPALKLEAARGFIALALVQGVPGQPNLGRTDQARENLNTAIALARAVGLADPAARALNIQALALRAMIEAHVDNKLAGADTSVREAAALLSSTRPSARTEGWFTARSRLRLTQFEVATLQQDMAGILRAASALDSEIEQWPVPMQLSRAAEIDQAQAAHARGIHAYHGDRLDEAVVHAQEAERRFATLALATPNDPAIGYLRAFNAYAGLSYAISTPNRTREAEAFQRVARVTIDRLRAIEPDDQTVMSLAGSIGGMEAQALSASGRHADALAMQMRNVELYRAVLFRRPKPANANVLVMAQLSLANIARDGGRRDVACATYPLIERDMAALDRRGTLVTTHANYRPRVLSNIANCRTSAPLIAL